MAAPDSSSTILVSYTSNDIFTEEPVLLVNRRDGPFPHGKTDASDFRYRLTFNLSANRQKKRLVSVPGEPTQRSTRSLGTIPFRHGRCTPFVLYPGRVRPVAITSKESKTHLFSSSIRTFERFNRQPTTISVLLRHY